MPSTEHSTRDLAALGAVAIAVALAVAGVGAVAADTPATGPADHSTGDSTTTGDANVTLWVGPGDLGDRLDDAEAVRDARADGALTRATAEGDEPPTLTAADTLVISLQAPDLGERLAAQPGPNATARLRHLVENGSATLAVTELYPSPMVPAMLPQLLDPSATRVVPSAGNTTHLVVDVDEVPVEYPPPSDRRELLVEGQYHDAVFGLNVTLGSANISTRFRTQAPELAFDTSPGTEAVYLRPNTTATVTGRTNLAPGTQFRLQADGDLGNLGDANTTVTVDANREFMLGVDTRGLPENLFVEAAHADWEFETRDAALVSERATLEVTDQRGSGDSLTVDRASLSYGGLVVVRGTAGNGSVLGATAVDASEAGQGGEVRVTLDSPVTANRTLTVAAYRDANDNGEYDAADRPYGVTATVNYTVDEPGDGTMTPEPTRTRASPDGQDSSTSPTAPTETGETTVPSETTTGGGAPGFGVVAGLLALLGVAGVAGLRRRT